MITYLRDRIKVIGDHVKSDGWQISMCHNDIYEPNLLVELDKLYLIDWEFAGDTDIGFDVCKLFAPNLVSWNHLDSYLVYYYGRVTTDEEKLHLLGCAAIQYYYWYIWAIYAEDPTLNLSEYMLLWHDRMDFYIREFETYHAKEK